jgi:hypothetical protein
MTAFRQEKEKCGSNAKLGGVVSPPLGVLSRLTASAPRKALTNPGRYQPNRESKGSTWTI